MSALCDGGAAWVERRVATCPTEGRRRRFVVRSQLWYGTTWTCLGCGDAWGTEGRYPRPFARGWRAKAIAAARAQWAAVTVPAKARKAAFGAWLREQVPA